jgi:hypothetical protein
MKDSISSKYLGIEISSHKPHIIDPGGSTTTAMQEFPIEDADLEKLQNSVSITRSNNSTEGT